MQRLRRNDGHWLAPLSWLSLLPSSIKNYLLMDGIILCGLCPTASVINQENILQAFLQAI